MSTDRGARLRMRRRTPLPKPTPPSRTEDATTTTTANQPSRTTGQQATTSAVSAPSLTRRDSGTDAGTAVDRDETTTPRTATIEAGPTISTVRTPTVTTTTVSRDQARVAGVNRVKDFLATRQGDPQSAAMRLALDRLQDASDAHDAGQLTDDKLDGALAMLDLIEITGRPTIPLTVALQPAFGPGMTVDGTPINGMTLELQEALSKYTGDYDVYTDDIVKYMIADGGFQVTTDKLGAMIQTVGATLNDLYDGKAVAGNDTLTQIARRMYSDTDPKEQGQFETTFPRNNSKVPTAQARAVNDVLRKYPQYIGNVKKAVKAISFASGTADDFGGGVIKDGNLYMSKLPNTSPDAFARLFVHETGHATFQRALLETNEIPDDLATGRISDLLVRRIQITDALNTVLRPTPAVMPAPGRPVPPGRPLAGQQRVLHKQQVQRELQRIDQIRDEVNAAWRDLPEDAKVLYQAWQDLRQDGGKYLIGIDLGPHPKGEKKESLHPSQRRVYQAGNFTEFCAESFMHLTMGDLDKHVAMIQSNPDVPAEVKEAWGFAQQILHKRGEPILGPST